jgi:hypothetical protein
VIDLMERKKNVKYQNVLGPIVFMKIEFFFRRVRGISRVRISTFSTAAAAERTAALASNRAARVRYYPLPP